MVVEDLSVVPSVSELMGLSKAQPQSPVTVLSVGNDQDFVSMAHNSKDHVAGVMWSENCITLVNENRFVVARYRPELTPTAEMFFNHDEKRDRETMQRIWEGEFAAVQFTKQNLLKFLKTVEMVDAPKEVIDAIRNMKVTEKNEVSESISLDTDNTKTVIEESIQTNLPKRFSLMIPVSDDFIGKFEFEARVAPAKNRYGDEEKNKKVIELRVTNARQVLRARMSDIVSRLPRELPKYYGRMDVRVSEGRWV
jgi:hypothetical protein